MAHKRVDIKTGFLCNNNCFFCVQAHKKRFGNRSTAEIKKDLNAAKLNKCTGVVFTGGEVTIREDIFELVKYARHLGFTTIQIQSNCRLLSYREFCEKLIKAGANEFAPALHGHTAKLHDQLTRSPGSFIETTAAIKNLKDLGQFIITNTVVVKPNYRHVPQIAQLLCALDVDQFQFAFVHAMGNAAENIDEMMPRVSLAAPYMMRGLQIGIDNGKRVMAEAMTPCLMPGYEKYCSELHIPETEIRDLDSFDPNFTKTRKTEGKIKFSWCKKCYYDEICEGPWKEYPEKMGSSEFRAVKKNTAEYEKKTKSKKIKASARLGADGSVIAPVWPAGFKRLLDEMFEKDNYNFTSLALVIFGNKKISRMCSSEKEVAEVIPYLDHFGVKYRVIPRAKTRDAFSFESKNAVNKYKLEDCDIKALKIRNQYLYLSRDKKLIDRLITAEIKGGHDIGLILGYPKCCVDFYKSKPAISDINMWNRILSATTGEAPYEFIINTFRLNRTVLLYFPCSLNCAESLKLGRDYLRTFNSIDSKYGKIYEKDLKKPVFLSAGFLVNFEDGHIRPGDKNITNFHTKGKKLKTLSAVYADHVIADGARYEGRLVKFK